MALVCFINSRDLENKKTKSTAAGRHGTMFMLATTSLSVVHKENPACAVPPCAPNPPLSWNPRQHRRNITRSRALPSLAERRTISTACRASGDCTWSSEFEAHILKVGQGESQLVIYPSGYTILIDAMEPSWNSTPLLSRLQHNLPVCAELLGLISSRITTCDLA